MSALDVKPDLRGDAFIEDSDTCHVRECHSDRALCGVDLSRAEYAADELTTCVVCADLDRMLPCPCPPDCSCREPLDLPA